MVILQVIGCVMTEIIHSQPEAKASEIYVSSWKSSSLPKDLVNKIETSEKFEDDLFTKSKIFEKFK